MLVWQSTTTRRNVADFARGQVGIVMGNVLLTMDVKGQDDRTTERVISRYNGES